MTVEQQIKASYLSIHAPEALIQKVIRRARQGSLAASPNITSLPERQKEKRQKSNCRL